MHLSKCIYLKENIKEWKKRLSDELTEKPRAVPGDMRDVGDPS